MASKDLHNNLLLTPVINPAAAITANGTTTSATVDTQGFESLEFSCHAGAITDGTFTGTVYEGDVSDMSDEAAATELLGSAPVFTSASDNEVKKVGYRGSKRYVRLKFVQSGATSGGYLSCSAIQGHARNAPAA